MTDTTDYFAAVPYRILDALRDGDISFRQFGILVYLIAEANHATRVVKTTIAELKSRLRLSESSDTIGRDLKVLLDQGWIEFEPRQGRALFRITLRNAVRRDEGDYRKRSRDSRGYVDDHADAVSGVRKARRGASRATKQGRGAPAAGRRGSPRSRSEDLDPDDDGERAAVVVGPCSFEGCDQPGTPWPQYGGTLYCHRHGPLQSSLNGRPLSHRGTGTPSCAR